MDTKENPVCWVLEREREREKDREKLNSGTVCRCVVLGLTLKQRRSKYFW